MISCPFSCVFSITVATERHGRTVRKDHAAHQEKARDSVQTISDHRPVRVVLSRMRFLHIWICAFLADSYGGFEKKMGSPKIIQTGLFLLGNCKKPRVWDLGCPYFRKSPCGFLWQWGYHKIPLKHGGPSIIFPAWPALNNFQVPGVRSPRRPWSISRWFSEENMVMFHGYVDFRGLWNSITSSWHPAGLLVFLMEICAISVNESLAKKEILSFKDANNMMLTEERPPSWSCSGCHTYEALWTQGSAISLAACWGCENEVSPHNGCFSGHRMINQWIQG